MSHHFEQHVSNRLDEELDLEDARLYKAAYEHTRGKLIKDILREIRGVNQSLSDHGEEHIKNVLHNTRKLISNNHETHKLSAIELYCLSMFILFHDVGNLFGRVDHHKNVGIVYDWARGKDAGLKHEKTMVIQASRAHTGLATDGTRDTLKEVQINGHLKGESVRLRDLAAILRFADELAEGPQRTSEFMRTFPGYEPNTQIYHDYASVTNIHIDRMNQRIQVTYEIDFKQNTDETPEQRDIRIRNLLGYIYLRIVKIDQERRYVRYYSKILSPFILTSVQMNFHYGEQLLPTNLPPLQLDDKVVPGDQAMPVEEMAEQYRIDSLIETLKMLI